MSSNKSITEMAEAWVGESVVADCTELVRAVLNPEVPAGVQDELAEFREDVDEALKEVGEFEAGWRVVTARAAVELMLVGEHVFSLAGVSVWGVVDHEALVLAPTAVVVPVVAMAAWHGQGRPWENAEELARTINPIVGRELLSPEGGFGSGALLTEQMRFDVNTAAELAPDVRARALTEYAVARAMMLRIESACPRCGDVDEESDGGLCGYCKHVTSKD